MELSMTGELVRQNDGTVFFVARFESFETGCNHLKVQREIL